MIRSLVSFLVLFASSTSFAAPTCNTNLTLSCSAIYQSFEGLTATLEGKSSLADENWDEPSLANCAATLYFRVGDTGLRVYAVQDSKTQVFNYSVVASAVTTKNGVTSAEYSNTLTASGSQGMILNMGSLTLPVPVQIGNSYGKTVYVGCSVK